MFPSANPKGARPEERKSSAAKAQPGNKSERQPELQKARYYLEETPKFRTVPTPLPKPRSGSRKDNEKARRKIRYSVLHGSRTLPNDLNLNQSLNMPNMKGDESGNRLNKRTEIWTSSSKPRPGIPDRDVCHLPHPHPLQRDAQAQDACLLHPGTNGLRCVQRSHPLRYINHDRNQIEICPYLEYMSSLNQSD